MLDSAPLRTALRAALPVLPAASLAALPALPAALPAALTDAVAEVPPELLTGGGVVGLLVTLFYMLATGRLVTRREADGYREDRDTWRETALVTAKQLERLLENDVMAMSILKSLDTRAAYAANATHAPSEVAP